MRRIGLVLVLLIAIQLSTVSVRVRSETHITSLPYEITSPGHYVLDTDWSGYANPLIKISSSDVVLDCSGRKLTGTGSGTCIRVEGVNNVTIHLPEIEKWYYGVYVKDSSNITLMIESNITICNKGMYLYNCENCSLSGSSWIKGPGWRGIWLSSSENCNITELNIANYTEGIIAWGGTNYRFTDLNFINCALYFYYINPGNGHSVENCYVNEKPLLYLEDAAFLSITGDYGEVVLLDCVNITFSGSLASKNSFLEVLRSENTTIINSELTDLKAIYIRYSKSTSIVGTTIQNSNYVSIVYSNNYTMVDCTLNPTNVDITSSDYCTLSNVAFENCGLHLYDSTDNTIVDCTVNGKPLVYLEDASGGSISGDVGQAILVDCENVEIDVNVSNTYVGVELHRSRNCDVRANVTNCNYGVWLSRSDNNTINNCYIESITVYGVYLYYSENNTIVNCYLVSTSSCALYIYYSDFNLVRGCTISDCNYGISVYYSDYCNVTECSISCTYRGVWLYHSYNGFIYLNDFLDFGYFSITSDSNYTWYSPEPITYCYMGNEYTSYLGNYYYDYTGSDENCDGIGDEAYSRNGMIDEYPLYNRFPHYIEPKLQYLLGLISWRGVFNATFIVGDTSEHKPKDWKAATADVVGAIRIAEAFSRTIGNAFVESTVDKNVANWTHSGVVIDWDNVTTPLLISVGGPGVNYVTYYYNASLPLYWKIIGDRSYICSGTGCYTCSKGYDYAIIAFIRDPDSCKLVLIVWGISRRGTQAACLMLQEYEKYQSLLSGRAVLVKWTDTNSNNRVDREDSIEVVESWD